MGCYFFPSTVPYTSGNQSAYDSFTFASYNDDEDISHSCIHWRLLIMTRGGPDVNRENRDGMYLRRMIYVKFSIPLFRR